MEAFLKSAALTGCAMVLTAVLEMLPPPPASRPPGVVVATSGQWIVIGSPQSVIPPPGAHVTAAQAAAMPRLVSVLVPSFTPSPARITTGSSACTSRRAAAPGSARSCSSAAARWRASFRGDPLVGTLRGIETNSRGTAVVMFGAAIRPRQDRVPSDIRCWSSMTS